jgi:desulfoferrodoxin (superoxide reductase-like protein)
VDINYNLIKFMEDIEMRKISLAVLFLLLIGSVAMAHPPSEVTAEFNLESNILSVEVVHSVGGDPVHFIESLTLSHNSKEIIVQQISKQLGDSQTFLYFIPEAEEGDEIEIVAVCNIFGDKRYKFTIEDSE